MNPYVLIAAGLLLVASFGAGWRVNGWRHDSRALHDEQLVAKAADALTDVAVDAIKSLRPVYTTINKGLEKEFHSEVRYTSADCSHTPVSWSLLDRAYQAAGGEPFGTGPGLPDPAAAAGSNPGSHNARPD